MNIESFREYCLAKPGATEGFPFGPTALVFKVAGKMFALTDVDSFGQVNLKVDPEEGQQLQERYEAVKPGYHMNKKHWITVQVDGSVSDRELRAWIDRSYELVVDTLPKSVKLSLITQ